MSSGKGLTLALVLAAVGCTTNADDDPAGGRSTFEIPWDSTRGFVTTYDLAHELDRRGESRMAMWVIGETVSAPLWTPPEALPDQGDLRDPIAYPDVVVPDQLESGTKVELYALVDGKVDHPVADLVVVEPPRETAFSATYPFYQNSCFTYCSVNGGYGCNCIGSRDPCMACWSHGYTNCAGGILLNSWVSADFPCRNQCGSCSGGTDVPHHCYTRYYSVYCPT
jgi:hypothetical protein